MASHVQMMPRTAHVARHGQHRRVGHGERPQNGKVAQNGEVAVEGDCAANCSLHVFRNDEATTSRQRVSRELSRRPINDNSMSGTKGE